LNFRRRAFKNTFSGGRGENGLDKSFTGDKLFELILNLQRGTPGLTNAPRIFDEAAGEAIK
jgi:hypothetical protein